MVGHHVHAHLLAENKGPVSNLDCPVDFFEASKYFIGAQPLELGAPGQGTEVLGEVENKKDDP